MYSTRIGTVAMTTTAISGGHCVAYRSWNCAMPSGRVQLGRSWRMIVGQKKPFQVPWNWRIATAAMAGVASGSTTRANVGKNPAPAVFAGLSGGAGDRQEELTQEEDRRPGDREHEDDSDVLLLVLEQPE